MSLTHMELCLRNTHSVPKEVDVWVCTAIEIFRSFCWLQKDSDETLFAGAGSPIYRRYWSVTNCSSWLSLQHPSLHCSR